MTELDVDNLVNKFLLNKQTGLITLHKMYIKNNNFSYRSFIEELFDELKNQCLSFIASKRNIEELESHLFYVANDFAKKKQIIKPEKWKNLVCPGCLFLGTQTLLEQQDNLVCNHCSDNLKKTSDSKWIDFFSTFKKHSNIGFRCSNCERFIPQPLSKSVNVICPYTDCFFVGQSTDLKKMIHPNSNSKTKNISKNITWIDNKDNFKIENNNELDKKIQITTDIIDQEINNIYWDNANFSIKHKAFVYQAFKNVLNKSPAEMIAYLLENSRSGGFQNKLFQEYISILESNIPIGYRKNKELKTIQSLLDPQLSIFDGISTFEAVINDKCIIKNNTQEMYMSSKKALHIKPFFIGKLLNVRLLESNDPIMHLVENYNFSRIILKSKPKTSKVLVTHLRVVPHYQMGGMVHINRVRKKIIDKVLLDLKDVNKNIL